MTHRDPFHNLDRHFERTDRTIRRTGTAFAVIWVIGALVSLAFVGVVIWGVIELVQWVTAR